MRLLDALLGRSRPVKSSLEPLFAMATASVTLTVELGLAPAGRAGVCLRPVRSTRFAEAEAEVRAILADGHTRVDFLRDGHGFLWVVLQNAAMEDLIAAMHMASLTLQEHGFGEQLLAAVFAFRQGMKPVYWIYNYKRAAFYPLVPGVGEHQRDNAAELRLQSLMEHELPLEKEQERWFPLWDMPL
ncbi:MAG: hypothetical protein AB7U81_00145 [Thiohalomonadaceae bacterium]